MANIFKAKTLVSRTGIFSHEVISPNLVYTTGDQTISGIKTFATGVNINGHVGIGIDNNNFNLYVRKSPAGVTVSPDSNSIAVFEGSGNSHITVLASNAQTAGVVLGSPADNFGAYLTWNHDNNALKLATANPNGFIQLLTNNEAEAVRITSGANVGIGTTSPSEKLEVIGNILANNLVYNTGNQTIYGLKDFTTKPTVNTIPVLLSGENAAGLNLFVKNSESFTVLKGQPVYINGAAGNNILIKLARNTGEYTSSKTLGLLSQDLAPNGQGYITTEGQLEGIDTDAGNAGDPIWLGPTGNLIFGAANKPYGLNHLVYLGVIERKQQNNGKIYVKVQNGFEIEELHNVDVNHTYPLGNNQVLKYNSQSGLWLNSSLTSNDLTDANNIVYTTGDQIIYNNKIFLNNIGVSGTGVFNAIDLNNIDILTLSGVDITITNGVVTLTNPVSAPNLVYNTGNQTIAGNKDFLNNINISGNVNATGRVVASTGIFGLNNNISGLWLTMPGGSGNIITANHSVIGGGQGNRVSGNFSVIGGGRSNFIAAGTNGFAFIGGGNQNTVSAGSLYGATIGGGCLNIACNDATIGGGLGNRAFGVASFIGGGCQNCAAGTTSTVAGGAGNYACSIGSSIVGGAVNTICGNTVLANYSFIGGGQNNIIGADALPSFVPYSIIVGGFANRILSSSSTYASTIGGGDSNCISNAGCSVIGGGSLHLICSTSSTIGGGECNCILASAPNSYIAGGRRAVIQQFHSGATVLGDGQNRVHSSSGAHTLTLDFASGVYFASPQIYGSSLIFNSPINISGNYDIYSQIENVKKLAIAYAIAL